MVHVVAGRESVLSAMLAEFGWFLAGALLVRVLMLFGVIQAYSGPGICQYLAGFRKEREAKHKCAIKQLCASATAGQYEAVLKVWGREKCRGTFPNDALEDVTEALAILTPERLVPELVGHIERYRDAYTQPSTTSRILEVAARSGHPALAATLSQALQQCLKVHADDRMRRALLKFAGQF